MAAKDGTKASTVMATFFKKNYVEIVAVSFDSRVDAALANPEGAAMKQARQAGKTNHPKNTTATTTTTTAQIRKYFVHSLSEL